jgi:molybdopterin converting factor small subunit
MRSKCSCSSKDKIALVIKVKLIGALTRLSGRSEVSIQDERRDYTVTETIQKLCRRVSSTEFEQAIIDPHSGRIGPHIIVLINDRDISALQGLETRIRNHDVLTLIPVAHGG